jgi:hypothetical protein
VRKVIDEGKRVRKQTREVEVEEEEEEDDIMN